MRIERWFPINLFADQRIHRGYIYSGSLTLWHTYSTNKHNWEICNDKTFITQKLYNATIWLKPIFTIPLCRINDIVVKMKFSKKKNKITRTLNQRKSRSLLSDTHFCLYFFMTKKKDTNKHECIANDLTHAFFFLRYHFCLPHLST